jgi:hypothetical protein
MEAVYGVMLPQPRIRHLMAHDAGAGKTIMGGLLYKELSSRQPDMRDAHRRAGGADPAVAA